MSLTRFTAKIINIHIEGHDGLGKNEQTSRLIDNLGMTRELDDVVLDEQVTYTPEANKFFDLETVGESYEEGVLGAISYLDEITEYYKGRLDQYALDSIPQINVFNRSIITASILNNYAEGLGIGRSIVERRPDDDSVVRNIYIVLKVSSAYQHLQTDLAMDLAIRVDAGEPGVLLFDTTDVDQMATDMELLSARTKRFLRRENIPDSDLIEVCVHNAAGELFTAEALDSMIWDRLRKHLIKDSIYLGEEGI